MTAETICEKVQLDTNYSVWSMWHSASLNCHFQILIHDGIIISHNYNTDYRLLYQLNIRSSIAELTRSRILSSKRLQVPNETLKR